MVILNCSFLVGNGTILWFSQHIPQEPSRYMEKKARSTDLQGIFCCFKVLRLWYWWIV